MSLAGILLKMGSYGLFLFLPYIKLNFLYTLYTRLALIGSVVCALICIRQSDMKLLIAYSSVVHMGVVTLGLTRGTEMGYGCRFVMVIAHGLCSPFLFVFSYVLYQCSHSRLFLNISRTVPIQTGCFMGLISLNMRVPPTLRLWAEVIITICVLGSVSLL